MQAKGSGIDSSDTNFWIALSVCVKAARASFSASLYVLFIMELQGFNIWHVLQGLVGFVGGYLLVTITLFDYLLIRVYETHAQTEDIEGSDMAEDLSKRMDILREGGVTQPVFGLGADLGEESEASEEIEE